MADEIPVRLVTESVREIQKSLNTICNEISENANRSISARWKAFRTCKISKFMCKIPEEKYGLNDE